MAIMLGSRPMTRPASAPRPRARAVPVRIARAAAAQAAPAPRQLTFKHRALITLTLAGALVALAGPATLASFNATTNPDATISSAVILLDNTQQSGADCVSSAGTGTVTVTSSNTNTGCTAFAVSGASAMPGQSLGPYSTTVRNVGNRNAATFNLYANGACTDSATAAMPYNGGGSLCGQIQLYIQRYSDSAFTTPSSCVYGAAAGATCSGFDSSHTLGNFASTYSSGSPISLGGLNASTSAYFKLFVSFPSSSNDTFQGRTADVVFVWNLQQ